MKALWYLSAALLFAAACTTEQLELYEHITGIDAEETLGADLDGDALIGTPPPVTTTTLPEAPEIVATGATARFWQLEQNLPAGAADGPTSFIRVDGEILLYAMHGNGNTYLHRGDSFDTLGPAEWTYGPTGGDADRYGGIASIVRLDSGEFLAAIHQESHADIATIGLAIGDGENWRSLGTVIRGEQLQASGFRGASLPSMQLIDEELVIVYENRFGSGRHQEIWHATADVNDPTNWTVQGQLFATDGDPHFYGDTPRLQRSGVHWLLTYGTDLAFRYRTSTDLASWSEPTTISEWPQRWTQGASGQRQWYAHLLDPQAVSSAEVGAAGIIVEHWIDLDSGERYPQRSDWRQS